MSNYFNIEFVPYGNAEVRYLMCSIVRYYNQCLSTYENYLVLILFFQTTISKSGEISFDCQHGPQECAANIIQACALKYLSYKDSVKFICCVEGRHSAPGSGPACAEELEVDYDAIDSCSNSPEGIKLHYLLGKQTDNLKPPHQYVPWILFNGQYNKEDMEHAQDDLLTVICKYIEDPKPDACNEVFQRGISCRINNYSQHMLYLKMHFKHKKFRDE